MTRYRRAALAVTAGTAGLSLAACSAGITTAGRAPASRPASAAAASPSPSASASASVSANPAAETRVNAPIRTFPVPRGANVVFNGSCPRQIVLMLNPVVPSRSIAFYTTELPRAGYRITGNLSSGSGQTEMMDIEFTGHGYSGEIIAFADMDKAIGSAAGSPVPAAPPGVFGGMTKNMTEVAMSPPGVSSTYNCPA